MQIGAGRIFSRRHALPVSLSGFLPGRGREAWRPGGHRLRTAWREDSCRSLAQGAACLGETSLGPLLPLSFSLREENKARWFSLRGQVSDTCSPCTLTAAPARGPCTRGRSTGTSSAGCGPRPEVVASVASLGSSGGGAPQPGTQLDLPGRVLLRGARPPLRSSQVS